MYSSIRFLGAPPDLAAAELRRAYGLRAEFSRVGSVLLVHLDSPTRAEVLDRVARFDPTRYLFDSCSSCLEARAFGGHLLFEP